MRPCSARSTALDDSVYVVQWQAVYDTVVLGPLPRLREALHLRDEASVRVQRALWPSRGPARVYDERT